MISKKENISVIGMGWLGIPLCKELVNAGNKVIATTTTPAKINDQIAGIDVQLFDIVKDTPDKNLLRSNIFIYTVPPLGLGEVEIFFNSVDGNSKIIFISSTSVYGKSSGNTNEESSFSPQTKNSELLIKAECYLRGRFKNLTVIRPGGLFNETRHPIYSLQGKVGLTGGQELLHLVHGDDCVKAILMIIKKQFWSEDFNLVNDLRVLKQVYYTEKARALGLIPPQYVETTQLNPTNISNNKSVKMLLLNYKK